LAAAAGSAAEGARRVGPRAQSFVEAFVDGAAEAANHKPLGPVPKVLAIWLISVLTLCPQVTFVETLTKLFEYRPPAVFDWELIKESLDV
jgi:hypothetical protein